MPKPKLEDLLRLKKGKSNTELHRDDPERRKKHIKYRTARDALVTPAAARYRRPLATDAKKDMEYHELAREFISNGMRQTPAYAAVYGVDLKQARVMASKIFNSTWMRSLIRDMLMGEDGEPAEISKEYALKIWMRQIESNVLDYVDDEGQWLNVKELKSLPDFAQQHIKKLNVHTWEEPVDDGNGGERMVRHQRVQIELIDKQRALEQMAKAMRWIETKGDVNLTVVSSDVMIEAQKRIEKLRKENEQAIEGTAARVATD